MSVSTDGTRPQPDQTSAAAGAPAGRWRLIILASLALNLLFAGAAAGSLWHSKRHYSHGSLRGAELAIDKFLRTVPKERAKELRKLLKATAQPRVEPLVAGIRQARRDAAAALSAQTFDREQLTAAFGRIDQAEATAKSAARGAILSLAANMTAAERSAMAAQWKARRPHMFEDPPETAVKDKEKDEAPAP